MSSLRMIGAVLVALSTLNLYKLASAQDALGYQLRANRHEGIRPKTVSNFGIELLSARVDYRDRPGQVGDRFHVRFYLAQPTQVYLVVREIDYKHYYWLDKVVPRTPWTIGFGNVFDWPTVDVIKQLKGLTSDELGVVARLEKGEPSADEKVAPVIFYQSQYPTTVKGYVFAFRLRDGAKIKAKLFSADGGSPLYSQDLGNQRGGRPFTVKWEPTANQIAGDYKLVLSGYGLSTSDPIKQTVRFHHEPRVE